MQYKCANCPKLFLSKVGLKLHLNHSPSCQIKYHDSTSFKIAVNDSHIQKKCKLQDVIDDEKEIITPAGYYNSTNKEDQYSSNLNQQDYIFLDSSLIEIKLLKLLNNMSSPHYAFQAIMEWAQDAYLSGYTFDPKTTTNELQIKKFTRWLNMSNCKPIQKKVCLPPDNL